MHYRRHRWDKKGEVLGYRTSAFQGAECYDLCRMFSVEGEDSDASLDERQIRQWIVYIYTRSIRHSLQKRPFTGSGELISHAPMDPDDIPLPLYTKEELKTLYRTLGHPSLMALEMLLRCADEPSADAQTAKIRKKVEDDCKDYKGVSSGPERFTLTVGPQMLRFNYRVQVDTMYMGARALVHEVDEANHFFSASFLHSQSTKKIWKKNQQMWYIVNFCPFDYLVLK